MEKDGLHARASLRRKTGERVALSAKVKEWKWIGGKLQSETEGAFQEIPGSKSEALRQASKSNPPRDK